MDDIIRYEIVYTETAAFDMQEKADYIASHFRDPRLAQSWYIALREEITQSLTVFPLKYPLYSESPWRDKDVRLLVTKSDVVLYRADLTKQRVWILGVCTKGRDLGTHLSENK